MNLAPLLLLAALQPAEPTLPIPTGSPKDPGPYIEVALSSSAGIRFGATYCEDGIEYRWNTTGTTGVWLTESNSTENTRVTILTRLRGVLPERIKRFEYFPDRTTFASFGWNEIDRFFCNSVAVQVETSGGSVPRVKVELHVYPLEGIMFTGGFDSRTFDFFSGLQLAF
jgi:hypothetical protein